MPKYKSQDFLHLSWQGRLSDYVTAITWTPDGTHLAACSAAGEVVLYDARTGNSRLLQRANGQSVDALSISHNGQFLASAGQSGIVTVWYIKGESLRVLSQLTYPHAWIDRLQWNPISPELAFGVGRQVLVWDALTQTIVTILDFETSSVLDLAWHPQGEYLAVSGNQSVKTWRQAYWNEAPMVQETGAASVAIAWSPNGTYLASGNNDHSILVWEWGNPYPWRMQGFPGKVRQLTWSKPIKGVEMPMLASMSADEVVLWKKARDPSVGWLAQILDQHQDTVTAIAFQPVSRMLASAANDGWLCLWRQGNQLTQRLQGAPKGFSALAWNAQGTALASAGRQGEMLVWGPTMRGKGFG